MGNLGASCFHTLSEGSRDLAPAEWDAERFGMVCTKAENFSDWEAAIRKLCRLSKSCTYNVKTKVATFSKRVNNFVLKVNDEKEGPEEIRR